MTSIDTTIVLISLPSILKQLPGTSADEGLWIIMSYSLITATLLLNFGRLGDMFGRVRTYNLGFAIFTVGSLLCSLSQTGDQLIAFRVLQGVGAAFLWANSAAIITDAFPVGERGRALGINQVAIMTGSVAGLALGGILTGLFGWRSIFWVNVPIGIFATIWSHYKLKELGEISKKEKLDIWGNVTFAGGLTLILVGVTLGAVADWSILNIILVGIGVVLMLAFLRIEKKVRFPMFQLSLFQNRVFATGNFAILMVGLAGGALSFMMVFYLQGILGYSALAAGILLVPLSVTIACFGPVSGWLSDKRGARLFVVLGLAANVVGFVIMSQLPSQISYTTLLIPLVILGAGQGLFASPNRSATLSSVPAGKRGAASGMNLMLMSTGQLLSLGMSVAVIALFVPHSLIVAVFGGAVLSSSSSSQAIAFMNGLHVVYLISAALALVSIYPVAVGYKEAKVQTESVIPPPTVRAEDSTAERSEDGVSHLS